MKRKHTPKTGWNDLDPQATGDRTRLQANQETQARELHETTKELTEKVGMQGSLGQINAGGVVVSAGLGVSAFEGGVRKSSIEPDGDVFFGSNINDPATTSFGVFANEQYYNTEFMEEGDVLFGNNSDGQSNVKWDESEGQLQFRFGTTVMVYMDTDGSLKAGAGTVALNDAGVYVTASNTSALFDDRAYKFVDADGNVMGGMWAVSPPDPGGQNFVLISANSSANSRDFNRVNISAVGSNARVRLEADQDGGDNLILEVQQAASGGTATIINFNGIDADTIIRGDTDDDLIHVDASTNRVGIGTATPAAKLDVNGGVNIATGNTYDINGSPHTHSGNCIYEESVSLGADGTFDHQNIPSTGKLLTIDTDARSDRAATGDSGKVKFNNDGGNNYVGLIQWGAGQTEQATAGAPTAFTFFPANNSPASWFDHSVITIPNYAGTNHYKSWQARGEQGQTNAAGNFFIYDAQGKWLSTNAINRVQLYPGVGTNFKAGSISTLRVYS